MALVIVKPSQTVQAVQQICTDAFNANMAAFRAGCEIVWANPQGLTPQQVLDELGSDASVLFGLSNALMPLLNQSLPANQQLPSPVPGNYTYVINADGTITLTKKG